MPQIPTGQREFLHPGGEQFPSPSVLRMDIAETKGRGVAEVGATLADIGFRQMRANDNAEFETATIAVEDEWNKAKIRLREDKNILTPNGYKDAAEKELNKIVSAANKKVNFRNKNRFKGVLESLKASAEKEIFLEFTAKTVDNSKAALDVVEGELSDKIISGRIGLVEGKATFAASIRDRIRNKILSEETGGERIRRFNESVSMELFLKDVQANPKAISLMTREEIRDRYELTEAQATRAKQHAQTTTNIEKQSLVKKIDDHINSIVSKGIPVISREEAESILDADELKSLRTSEGLAVRAYNATNNISMMTDRELDNVLKSFDPIGGSENFNEQIGVFEQIYKVVQAERKERKDHPFRNAAKEVNREGMTTEQYLDKVLSVQDEKGIPRYNQRISDDEDIEDLKKLYSNENTSGKINLRFNIESNYGKYAQRFIGELMDKEFDNVFNIIGGMSSTLAIHNLVEAQDKEKLRETEDILGTSVVNHVEKQVLDIFNTTMGNTLPLSESGKDKYRIPVENLALFYARQGESEPALKAMSEVYNDNYRYIGTIRIPIDAEVDEKKLGAFLSKIRKGEVIDLTRMVKDYEGNLFPEDFFAADFMANAEFYTNETEDGFIIYKDRFQMLEDVRGRPGGERFEFKFKDINLSEIEIGTAPEELPFTFLKAALTP